MTHTQLLHDYFDAANAHDVEKTLQYFASDAVVQDEGATHQGRDAIRQWLHSTNIKYHTQYSDLHIVSSGEEATVRATVSGTFPGSPIQLTSKFKFANSHIVALTCGL